VEISFDDIEYAFMYISSNQQYMNNAYLCKETGKIFYTSEMYDSDELPEDIEDHDKHITIPHKNDLQLVKSLVFEFASKYLPDELDKINPFFYGRGAYSRYEDFSDRKGLLDKWYKFVDERQNTALEQLCLDNNIEFTG
jgi:hypothetical protein